MEKNINIQVMIDRISELPECILHHILSFLKSPADLVRSSTLSKRWFALTASFPILNFDEDEFNKVIIASLIPIDIHERGDYARDKFLKYVAYTTSRFCQQNLSAQTFKLQIVPGDPAEIDIIDTCVGLILKKDVKVFGILIRRLASASDVPKYRLPNILLSTSSLTSLMIDSCELPSSLMVDIKFKSLKQLLLNCVTIDEEVIKHLTTSCPLLEELNVNNCYGIKRFSVCGLQNLTKVLFSSPVEVETIDIEAPNLWECDLFFSYAQHINLASCKQLRTLCLDGYPFLLSGGFANLLSNFPFLDKLCLGIPGQCNSLKLSSPSLRKLFLFTGCDLEDIDINTPNLLLFSYSNWVYPLEYIQDELKTRMEICVRNVDSLWFQKLRRFLDKRNGFKALNLYINSMDQVVDVEQLKLIQSPPYELEHVELDPGYNRELSVYLAHVEAVVWCCRPRSLSLTLDFLSIDFEEQSHIVKYTYETLLQQEGEGQTNIQFVLSSSSKANMNFSYLNSLLIALPPDHTLPYDQRIQKVTFVKEKIEQRSRMK